MRLVAVVAALLLANISFAQDNIVLRNGEDVSAKVLEISQTELKYRKTANPDGPVYTAPLRDVLFIKYANGTKDTFGPVRPTPGVRVNRPHRPEMNGQSLATTEAPTSLNNLRYHRRFLGGFYTDGTGGRLGLNETESALAGHPIALRSLERGRSLRTWSIATGIPAIVLIGAGIGTRVADMGNHRFDRGGRFDRPDNTGQANTTNDRDRLGNGGRIGMALTGGGVLLGAASLWLGHRSTVQFRRAAKTYNNRTATSLNITPSTQGIGLGAVLTF